MPHTEEQTEQATKHWAACRVLSISYREHLKTCASCKLVSKDILNGVYA